MLEPDLILAGDRSDVIEAPNAEDLKARLLDVVHGQVNIGVADAADRAPVAVGTSKVLGHPIDVEARAAHTRVGPGRRVAGAGERRDAGGAEASRGRGASALEGSIGSELTVRIDL